MSGSLTETKGILRRQRESQPDSSPSKERPEREGRYRPLNSETEDRLLTHSVPPGKSRVSLTPLFLVCNQTPDQRALTQPLRRRRPGVRIVVVLIYHRVWWRNIETADRRHREKTPLFSLLPGYSRRTRTFPSSCAKVTCLRSPQEVPVRGPRPSALAEDLLDSKLDSHVPLSRRESSVLPPVSSLRGSRPDTRLSWND